MDNNKDLTKLKMLMNAINEVKEDEELDEIAEEFAKADFEEVNPRTLIKMLIKVSPKALVKLGKLF